MWRIYRVVLFALILLGLFARVLFIQPEPLIVNRISVKVMKGVLFDSVVLVDVEPELDRMAETDCNSNWMLGLVEDRLGDQTGKKAAWRRLLDCNSPDLNLILATGTQDEDFVRQIVKRYPSNPLALFTLAQIVNGRNLAETTSLLEQSVSYDPSNGQAWCYLASLYNSDKQPDKAVNAFLNCCYNGDPGSHGCYGAGQVMEKLGNLGKAIEYYRLSSWEGALNRANELEKQLQP